MELEELGNGSWPRVKPPEFDRGGFLADYNEQHSDSLGRVDPVKADNSPDQKELTYACWRALFNLRDHYRIRNRAEYGFTYLEMTNLFLSSKTYPKAYLFKNREKIKKFQFDFISILRRNATEFSGNNDTLYKWTLIAGARLCMDYLRKFPKSRHRQDLLRDAYTFLKGAIKLQTTKTIYLLLAEVVEDFNYRPENWSQEKAENKVKRWFKKVLKQRDNSSTKPRANAPKPNYKLTQKFAKPAYMNRITNSQKVQLMLASLKQKGEEEENCLLSWDTKDETSFLCKTDDGEPSIPVDGKLFNRQNVSGDVLLDKTTCP